MISEERARQLIRNEPYRIGHYMGFEDLAEMHNGWLRSFLFNPEDQTLQAHRGSYKTTCLSLALAISIVIRPWESIDLFRKTDTDTVEVVRQTKNILQSGAMFDIALAVTGVPLYITKDSKNEIDTTLHQGITGAPQLRGMGIGTSITGKHGDLIVTDDIVNISDRVSSAEREKTKLAYMELQNIKNRGGRFINTGTPWHKDDAFSLMPNIQKFDCYHTGLIPKDKLDKLKSSMSHSLFAANYELRHIATDDVLFTEPKLGARQSMAEQGLSHVDAAFYGDDYTALTICATHAGKFYVFGKCWRKHVDDVTDEIAYLHNKFNSGKMHVELNADKGYVAKQFRERGIKVGTYHEKQNKYVKISTHLKFEWENVVFVEGTDDKYIEQICDYNEHAEHDDCPDSLASLIRIMARHKNRDIEDLDEYLNW